MKTIKEIGKMKGFNSKVEKKDSTIGGLVIFFRAVCSLSKVESRADLGTCPLRRKVNRIQDRQNTSAGRAMRSKRQKRECAIESGEERKRDRELSLIHI